MIVFILSIFSVLLLEKRPLEQNVSISGRVVMSGFYTRGFVFVHVFES